MGYTDVSTMIKTCGLQESLSSTGNPSSIQKEKVSLNNNVTSSAGGGVKNDRPGSLVIRFTVVDPARPVYLFHEQEPGHRVGERHLRERESHIAP